MREDNINSHATVSFLLFKYFFIIYILETVQFYLYVNNFDTRAYSILKTDRLNNNIHAKNELSR